MITEKKNDFSQRPSFERSNISAQTAPENKQEASVKETVSVAWMCFFQNTFR